MLRLSVGCSGRGYVDDTTNAMLDGNSQQINGAKDVDIRVKAGLSNASANIHLGRMVIYHIGLLGTEHFPKPRAISHINLVEASLGIQISLRPARQIVHHGNL